MKSLIGSVTSLANQQTVIVEVSNRWQHPVYKKFVKKSKKHACQASAAQMKELQLGDQVEITTIRPISKTKHFVVVKKLVN